MFFGKKEEDTDIRILLMNYIEKMYPIPKDANFNELLKISDELLKCYNSFMPLTDLYEKEINSKIEARFIFHSVAIDGNIIPKDNLNKILKEDSVIEGYKLSSHIEILNQKDAINFIRAYAKKDGEFDESFLLNLHYIILKTINTEYAGIYRKEIDTIGGSSYAPSDPKDIPQEIEKLIEYYNECIKNHIHPEIIASEIHERLCFIKPFEDANGMLARLVMNFIFLKFKYPLVNISSSIEGRLDYFEALEASKTDMETFYRFIVKRTIKNLSYAIQELATILPMNKSVYFYKLIGEKLGEDKKKELISRITF